MADGEVEQLVGSISSHRQAHHLPVRRNSDCFALHSPNQAASHPDDARAEILRGS